MGGENVVKPIPLFISVKMSRKWWVQVVSIVLEKEFKTMHTIGIRDAVQVPLEDGERAATFHSTCDGAKHVDVWIGVALFFR